MKRIIGIIAFLYLSLFSYAQEIQQKNVPAVVLNAFQLKFPNATEINWKLEKGNYRIGFETNNKDNELLMNDKGNILKQQQDLYVSEIPKIVLETIQSKVAFFDVRDADRMEEGRVISYKIDLKINEKNHEFRIDEKGRLLKHTKELTDSEVPAQIVTLIQTKYGSLDMDDARVIEENGKMIYLLKGEINDKDHIFLLNDKYSITKHEQELRRSELPVAVVNAAKSAYVGFELRDANLTEEGGQVIYNLEMRKSKEKMTLALDKDGKILGVNKN
jgi:uncharacterized membrane protein YkoI